MPKKCQKEILLKFEAGVRENWDHIQAWFNEKHLSARYTHKWLHTQIRNMRDWLELNWDKSSVQTRPKDLWPRFVMTWCNNQVKFDTANRVNMGGHARDREKRQDRATDFKPVNEIMNELHKRGMKQ